MKRTVASIALYACLPQPLHAQAADEENGSKEERLRPPFIDIPAGIATRTRLNADCLPGMVSVPYGRERPTRTVGVATGITGRWSERAVNGPFEDRYPLAIGQAIGADPVRNRLRSDTAVPTVKTTRSSPTFGMRGLF